MSPRISSMAFLKFGVLASLTAALPQPVARQASPELSLTAQLLLADSAADRYALLPNDSDYIYDFNTAGPALPSRKTFPALTGVGVSAAYATVPPCRFGALHFHPRASEIFLTTSGELHSMSIAELGSSPSASPISPRVLQANMTAGMMTIFPMGALHVVYNPTCSNSTGVAAFSSDDEGFLAVAPGLLALGDEVLGDVLGDVVDGEMIAKLRETVTVQGGVLEGCKATCGL